MAALKGRFNFLTSRDQAMEAMRKSMIEFGLTPSSRSRLSVPNRIGVRDELEEFLNAG